MLHRGWDGMCMWDTSMICWLITIIVKVDFTVSVYFWPLFELSMFSKYLGGFLCKESTENICSNLWYILYFFFCFYFIVFQIYSIFLECLGFYSDQGLWFNWLPDVHVFCLFLLYYFTHQRKKWAYHLLCGAIFCSEERQKFGTIYFLAHCLYTRSATSSSLAVAVNLVLMSHGEEEGLWPHGAHGLNGRKCHCFYHQRLPSSFLVTTLRLIGCFDVILLPSDLLFPHFSVIFP